MNEKWEEHPKNFSNEVELEKATRKRPERDVTATSHHSSNIYGEDEILSDIYYEISHVFVW